MISALKRDEILSRLIQLEKTHQVQILYACESGSRAWGFASADSDYDVRFLYLHPLEWYLDIDLERKRDVIECPLVDEFDINGWELRKALGLLRKSNPPLLEWLGSPIVYREWTETVVELRDLSRKYFSAIACGHHYFNMAKQNYREYLCRPRVRLKKYLYVLRPLLAVLWIEQECGVVPTEFGILVDQFIQDKTLKAQINDLLDLKRQTLESEEADALPRLNQFIEQELERLSYSAFAKLQLVPNSGSLNDFFRSQVVARQALF